MPWNRFNPTGKTTKRGKNIMMTSITRRSVSWIFLFTLFTTFSTAASARVSVDQPAPDFTAVDSSGKEHRLSDFRGKTVVLEWTNHDCPYVRKHYDSGNMQALQKSATGKGIVWLSIISSAPGKQGHVSAEEANSLTSSRNAAPTAVLLDESGEVGRLYGAKTTPHMYIIDAGGKLVYMGGIDSIPSTSTDDIARATNYVDVALSALSGGQPIEDAVTRPYGCSVKY
jgi:peroxiredoxin